MDDDWNDDDPNRRVDTTWLAANVHPGAILREAIDGNGETVTATARRLGISRAALNRVLAGKGSVTPRLALALEGIGWSRAQYWMDLQTSHDIARLRLGTDEEAA